jgi:hypothetical protein
MMKAHHRLNDFLERGTVPEDLKRKLEHLVENAILAR